MPSDLTDLRCLTVRQPWASQLIDGSKPAEYRAAPLPRTLGPLPVWVGIHAGSGAGLRSIYRRQMTARGFPLGAVIGAVEFVACEHLVQSDTGVQTPHPLHESNPDRGRWPFAWAVGRRVVLVESMPARGGQGLWRPGDDVREALVAAIEEVADGE